MVLRSTGRHRGGLRPRIVAPGQLEPRPTGPPWLKYSECSRTPDFAHYLRPPGALVVGRGGVLIEHGTPARSTVPTPGPEATTIVLNGPRNRRTRRSDGGRGGPVFADPERPRSGPARGRRTPLGGRLRGRGGRVADKAGSGGRGGQGHTSTSTRSSTCSRWWSSTVPFADRGVISRGSCGRRGRRTARRSRRTGRGPEDQISRWGQTGRGWGETRAAGTGRGQGACPERSFHGRDGGPKSRGPPYCMLHLPSA